jgi:6-phosphogluconolactonase
VGSDGAAANPGSAGPLVVYTQDGARIQAVAVDRSSGDMTKKAAVDACMGAVHLLLDRGGRRLFGACPGDKGLVVLNVDRATGALTRAGLASGGVAVGLGVHPSGDFVLTADYDGGATLYRIGADGKPETAQRAAAGVNTHGARFDGLGKYAYVTNAGSNSITQFALQGGKLAPLDPPTVEFVTAEPVFAGKKEPRYLIDSPDGRFVYVIGQRPPSVFQFKVGPSGALSKNGLGVSALDTALTSDINGKDLVLSPSGEYLYASVYSTNKIAVFSVDRQSGAVTLVRSVDSGGMGVGQLAVDPAGQFLFAAHQSSKEVVAFRLDARTGVPTVLPGRIKVADTQAVAALVLSK